MEKIRVGLSKLMLTMSTKYADLRKCIAWARPHPNPGQAQAQGEKARSPSRRMDRLRRSFRDSFRRRKEPPVAESSKPHQWQLDEAAVRAGTCCFHVKYMGCVEVFESRGMQVCEEALKVLRNSRRRRVRAILYVSGDGLRVVEDETKGLIVDQTIEKVSFCAPDRNHDKGFSYICRDGTTRRWMCHGFLALRESGERLSHAVGCAFAACLERKQRRDKDYGVTMKFDAKNATFTRSGSFRQPSLTERLADPQELKATVPFPWEVERPNVAGGDLAPAAMAPATDPVPAPVPLDGDPVAPAFSAPAAPVVPALPCAPVMAPCLPPAPEPVPPAPAHKVGNPYAIERPHATVSMLQRQGSFRGFSQLNQASPFKRQLSLRIGDLPSTLERQRSLSLEPNDTARLPLSNMKPPVSPIPEASPLADRSANHTAVPPPGPPPDLVSAMCQELSQGLLLLSADDFQMDSLTSKNNNNNSLSSANGLWPGSTSSTPAAPTSDHKDPLAWTSTTLWPRSDGPSPTPAAAPSPAPTTTVPTAAAPPLPTVVPVPTKDLPRPEQWLGKIATVVNPHIAPAPAPSPSPRRAPMMAQHARAYSLGSAESYMGRMNANGHHPSDPFDADWAATAAPGAAAAPVPVPASTGSTNPFLGSSVKAFEVRM